jgi:GNAT superfamily N-acetyltransferase
MFTVEPATSAHFDRLAALFEECSSACYCRYWHFGGTKNDWLERCAMSPEENRSELEAALAKPDDSARGLVSIDSAAKNKPIVGWMKLAPRASLPKLQKLPVYRSRPHDSDERVFSIGCFLVHPAYRKRGVARALVEGSSEAVRAWGGNAIEAYPHAIDRTMYDEEAWMGPASIFEHAGFTIVAGELPYPVLRLVIGDRMESRM